MKIVVDAMGGDYAPTAVIAGAISAIKELNVKIVFVGQEDVIKKELSRYQYSPEDVEIVHAPEAIDMHEPATSSIRTKKNSSISIGVNLLKQPSYDAFVSAGNTGAVVCAATIYLGMIKGIDRPGIGLVIPTLNRFAFLIDVGANPDPKPEHLLQYSLMSRVYAQEVLRIENPSVGLLNIGEEEGKGTDFAKETHKLLSERVKNFIGNVEPNELFSGKCSCIVSDGFTGNIMIKVSEGLMESIATLLKREIKKSPMALAGAALLKPCLNDIKKYADYSEYGGAPLLGVNGIVMISHGRSSPKAIKNAIRAAKREVEHNILAAIIKEVG
ncbi:MAG: phosphate acyltransferase PlsX [Candidatus Omnitrophota bacterium]